MVTFDITDGINVDLGTSYAAPVTTGFTPPAGVKWDCAIGGLPFIFGISDQFPFKRETASFRKDRVDTGQNPGEQSLDSGYWLRSQSSWHYGSGLASAEPLEVSDAEAHFRYRRGGGVDPWTAGQVSLLHDTQQAFASTGATQMLLGVDTGVLHADGLVLKYVTTGSSATVTWGGSVSSITSITSDGASYYAANTVGIYKGALPSGAGALLWNTGATTLCRWVKSRLFAAVGTALYELVGGAPPTLPTALYTHPATGWTWTDFAEGPAAIYASGYVGDTSLIYRITVGTTATTVTLNQPTVVAELPRGELVKSLYSYVGSYLIVGTTKGARVGLINSDGSLTLGPLTVESTDGCLDATADGSFVYVTVGSKGEAGNRTQRSGLYRIDLGTPLTGNPLKFSMAADLVSPSGTAGSCDQVTSAGGLLWFTSSTAGVYRQNSNYVSSGWLETGRIRMGTVESKAWRMLRVLGDTAAEGSITAYASSSESTAPSTWTPVVTNSQSDPDQSGSLNAAAPVPLSSIYLAFNLIRSATTTTTPIFIGYQLKAVPAPVRSELIQVPVMCYDSEKDRNGYIYGSSNGAWARFQAVKALENTSATVRWVDYTTGEAAEAYVEKVDLTRLVNPTKGLTGGGGIMQVTLRLV